MVYDRNRPDLARHITEAVTKSVFPGAFISLAEICGYYSSQYPDDTHRPSSGAVAARLFPTNGKCTVPGVIPEVLKDVRGARRPGGGTGSTQATFSDA